jgi:hypothetical protein
VFRDSEFLLIEGLLRELYFGASDSLCSSIRRWVGRVAACVGQLLQIEVRFVERGVLWIDDEESAESRLEGSQVLS